MLAHGTAFDVLPHELRETRPLKLGGDELASFEVTQVASSLVVVAAGKDGATEGVLRGNIDTTFVG